MNVQPCKLPVAHWHGVVEPGLLISALCGPIDWIMSSTMETARNWLPTTPVKVGHEVTTTQAKSILSPKVFYAWIIGQGEQFWKSHCGHS
jgi:hypothetical protein